MAPNLQVTGSKFHTNEKVCCCCCMLCMYVSMFRCLDDVKIAEPIWIKYVVTLRFTINFYNAEVLNGAARKR